jgi:hypothetical protein
MKKTAYFPIICRFVLSLALVNGFQLSIHAQLKYEIPTLKYPAADAFVVSINVMDYGADNTGVRDNYRLFTQLLEKLKTNHPGGAGKELSVNYLYNFAFNCLILCRIQFNYVSFI